MSTNSGFGSGCRERLAIASSLATILALVVAVLALARAMLNVTWPLGWSAEDLICAPFGNNDAALASSMLAAAGPASTSTSVPTTATLTRTITPLPPTDTPEPAITPIPPTATLAASGVVSTTVPITAQVVYSATTTPITAQVVYSATTLHTVQTPVLLKPSPDDQLHGQVLFQWRWDNQPLPEGTAFDLLIWSEEEHQEHGGAGALGVIEPGQYMESIVDLDYVHTIMEHGGGIYYWIVIVVQQEPYERVGAWGEPRAFTYTLPEPPESPASTTPSPPP